MEKTVSLVFNQVSDPYECIAEIQYMFAELIFKNERKWMVLGKP